MGFGIGIAAALGGAGMQRAQNLQNQIALITEQNRLKQQQEQFGQDLAERQREARAQESYQQGELQARSQGTPSEKFAIGQQTQFTDWAKQNPQPVFDNSWTPQQYANAMTQWVNKADQAGVGGAARDALQKNTTYQNTFGAANSYQTSRLHGTQADNWERDQHQKYQNALQKANVTAKSALERAKVMAGAALSRLQVSQGGANARAQMGIASREAIAEAAAINLASRGEQALNEKNAALAAQQAMAQWKAQVSAAMQGSYESGIQGNYAPPQLPPMPNLTIKTGGPQIIAVPQQNGGIMMLDPRTMQPVQAQQQQAEAPPAGAVLIGKDRKTGKPVYKTPDNRLWVP
jgi:hypothetical protein